MSRFKQRKTRIIAHGFRPVIPEWVRFKCSRCGCEFERRGRHCEFFSMWMPGHDREGFTLSAECPDCGRDCVVGPCYDYEQIRDKGNGKGEGKSWITSN